MNYILLVEGTAGIGKSTLIKHLIQKYIKENGRIRSFLHLSQTHTYAPLAPDEDNGTLTKRENINLIDSLINTIEVLTSPRTNLNSTFYCIIETLHLTHCFRPRVLNWQEIESFDQKLSDLGGKLVFLEANEKTIWERCVWGRRENSFITDYGQKFGSSLESIHQYFIQEQSKMMSLLNRSKMVKIKKNIDGDIEEYLNEVYEYWIN